MTLNQFKNYLKQLIGTVIFDYKGYSCGVDPINKTKYDIWCGEKITTVESVDSVLTSDIFDGKRLIDIFDECSEFDY